MTKEEVLKEFEKRRNDAYMIMNSTERAFQEYGLEVSSTWERAIKWMEAIGSSHKQHIILRFSHNLHYCQKMLVITNNEPYKLRAFVWEEALAILRRLED